MNTDTASAAPQAAALEIEHNFNEGGVCEAPEVVVVADMPEHFRAEIRLARAADGWRVGFEYEGPPIGVSLRGVLPCLDDAGFSERSAALAVGVRQLLTALEAKAKAKKAAAAVGKWAKEQGIDLHADQPRTGTERGTRRSEAADEPTGAAAPAEPPPAAPTLQLVPLSHLETDAANPRKVFDEDSLEELAASIAANGVLQPLVVRKLRPEETLIPGSDYRRVVVAGERRYRAAALAAALKGVSHEQYEVPCVVYEQLTERQALIIALTENLQRAAMNPIEEAEGFARLAGLGLTQAAIAEIVHKSRPVVGNALRLLELPAGVIQRVRDGLLTTAHGLALLRFRQWPDVAERMSSYAMEIGVSAGDLEKGLPFGLDLESEGLVAWIDRGEYFADDSLNEDKVPAALAAMPWLYVDSSDKHAAEPELWALDPAAWEAMREKLVAERLEREAKARRAAKKAAPATTEPAPGEDAGEEVERDNAAERAAEEKAAQDLEAQREETRREIDAAWQATVKGLRDLTEVRREHLAMLVEWASSDHRIGMVAENVDEAAHAIGLELPRSLKTIGNGGGAADKLAKFSPIELVRFALALRARAMLRLARREALAVPDELRLFTTKPVSKKPAKAKALKKAA